MSSFRAMIYGLLLVSFCLGFLFAYFLPEPTAEFTCSFDKLQGTFQVSSKELDGYDMMVFASRDGRTMLLRREHILTCVEVRHDE